MTNHWIDIGNSDRIMIIGSNAAENHPMSFKWVSKAMDNGAKLLSIDPRFTRTSSLSDLYVPLRSGTDIALIGSFINYILQNGLYFKEYVVEHTNAAFILKHGYEELFKDGVWKGFEEVRDGYGNYTDRTKNWDYKYDKAGVPKRDDALKNRRCVFQVLKKHFSRYDFETVSRITGTPTALLREAAKLYAESGKRGMSGTVMYAMGTTQHTKGAQMIRSYVILQLLLGNMGVAGGGINALRGESNVQGSTDHCLLFHIIPGYLKVPKDADENYAAYIKRCVPQWKGEKSVNYWKKYENFLVSLMKAWYGEYATKGNDWAFDFLPKVGGNYSHMSLFEAMGKGEINGLFAIGQNPAVAGPNSNVERDALAKLDWMICADLWETETAAFWKRPGFDSKTCKTEVFLLPAASSVEKEGSITNSGRWMQWRYKAAGAPGDAMDDLWIFTELHRRLKRLYEKDGGKLPEAITKLTWDYGEHPDPHRVAREINGYDLNTGKLLPSFGKLKNDGTTSSGNWLYCASYTEAGNMAARRVDRDDSGIGLYSEWSWCWPVNRRIIYNRASCDINGNPWDPTHTVIRWNGERWVGDVPDYGRTAKPDSKDSFIMVQEGVARIWAWGKLVDGPLPAHYEPLESPVAKNLLYGQKVNPAIHVYRPNEIGDAKKYPIIGTTYRVTEHWQSGPMTRNLPWLAELQPSMFCEMSEELAAIKGVKNGDKLTLSSKRGEIEAFALVTKRFKPFKISGKTVHEIGVPWHYGYQGIATGDSANILTPHVGDANTRIPEFKAFLCNVEKA